MKKKTNKWCPFAFINVFVLVPLGCCNNILGTRRLINNGHLFLIVLSLEVWDQNASLLKGGPSPGCRPVLVSSCGSKGWWTLWNLFYKSNDSVLPLHDLSTSQSPFLLISASLVIHEYRRNTDIQIIATFKQIFYKSFVACRVAVT